MYKERVYKLGSERKRGYRTSDSGGRGRAKGEQKENEAISTQVLGASSALIERNPRGKRNEQLFVCSEN